MTKIKVKLSNKFSNQFLTTSEGYIFYKENNTLGKPSEPLEVEDTSYEIRQLVAQGILIRTDGEAFPPLPKSKGMTTENFLKEIIDKPAPNTISEKKTVENSRKVEKVLDDIKSE